MALVLTPRDSHDMPTSRTIRIIEAVPLSSQKMDSINMLQDHIIRKLTPFESLYYVFAQISNRCNNNNRSSLMFASRSRPTPKCSTDDILQVEITDILPIPRDHGFAWVGFTMEHSSFHTTFKHLTEGLSDENFELKQALTGLKATTVKL